MRGRAYPGVHTSALEPEGACMFVLVDPEGGPNERKA